MPFLKSKSTRGVRGHAPLGYIERQFARVFESGGGHVLPVHSGSFVHGMKYIEQSGIRT